jgi:hypothetical protein
MIRISSEKMKLKDKVRLAAAHGLKPPEPETIAPFLRNSLTGLQKKGEVI